MPKTLRRLATAVAAFLAIVVPAAGAAAACPAAEPASSAAITAQIAALRSASGLPALAPRRPITTPARTHSVRMARAGSLWHDDLASWAGAAPAGQNVAQGGDAGQAFRAMVESPPHRGAMLSRRYRFIGVGAVRGCDGLLVVTVNLMGRPPRR